MNVLLDLCALPHTVSAWQLVTLMRSFTPSGCGTRGTC
jgi:hypothetical protein